ncbi:MAG: TorF family putative porin, partial [Burkholderiales bacterium]
MPSVTFLEITTMRKTVLATALVAATALPGLASAQAASPVTGNLSIVTDYRFRGISQTFAQPAIQGGIDYTHSSGFYLGNWDSNVSGLFYTDGSLEMDFYGGYRFNAGPLGMDVGLLQYYYPNAKITGGTKYDTLEAYVAASWKWLTAKYSITTGDFFGANNTTSTSCTGSDSKGSGYFDLSASYEIAPKLTLVGHYGNQSIKDCKPLEYSDYKVGINYDMNGWVLGAAYIDTDADSSLYTLTDGSGKMKDIGKSTVV